MTGEALVCKLKNLEPIEDADNLLKADMYGETIIVSKDHEEGELGLLFDCETQLSHPFCHFNNLYRHSELNADQTQQGYFDDNRRVRPIRLRGVKCSGFWMPIKSLDNLSNTNRSKDSLEEGTQITSFQGTKICQKYKKGTDHIKNSGSNNKKKKKKTLADLVPDFYEHFKTDYFLRNPGAVNTGDVVVITEKLHGTSCRCGNLRIEKDYDSFWDKFTDSFLEWMDWKDKEEYGFVVGSRRVVKSVNGKPREGVNHYYEDDLWSKACNEHFKGKLNKGETVYFEIVGYTPTGSPIMGSHSNKKLKDFMSKEEYKEFKNKYGRETEFSYGCTPEPFDGDSDLEKIHNRIVKIVDERGIHSKKNHGHYSQLHLEDGSYLYIDSYNKNLTHNTKEGKTIKHYGGSWGGFRNDEANATKEEYLEMLEKLEDNVQYKVFVYRITQTTPTGETIDYSWNQLKRRCLELDVEHVPELDADLVPDHEGVEENLEKRVKFLTESESDRFKEHLKEGICVRVESGGFTPKIFKQKAFNFKVLEGIIKDKEDYKDIEENN